MHSSASGPQKNFVVVCILDYYWLPFLEHRCRKAAIRGWGVGALHVWAKFFCLEVPIRVA